CPHPDRYAHFPYTTLFRSQSMIAHMTGLDVSNASMYDGASALAEAIIMAIRANRKSKSKMVLVPDTLNPVYKRVANNIVKNQERWEEHTSELQSGEKLVCR